MACKILNCKRKTTKNFELHSSIVALLPLSISLKRGEVLRKSEQRISVIADNLYKHIRNEDTYKKMFAWCEEQLPDDTSMEKVRVKVDNLVMDRVNKELKLHMLNSQITQLETFLKDLFNADCYVILEECQQMEEILLGKKAEVDYIKRDQTETGYSNFLQNLNLGAGEKAFLAITSPVLIPATIAFGAEVGILLLPFGAGTVIKDKVKDRLKLLAYRNDKVKFAKKRADQQLNNITPFNLKESINSAVMQNIENCVDELFTKIIPNRIAAGETLLSNIRHDMRATREIRQECHRMEREVFPIYGRIVSAYIDLFEEGSIKREDVKWSVSNAHENIALKDENEMVQVSSRKLFEKIDSLAHYAELAEIQILRKYSHQNVVKLYGVYTATDKIRTGYYLFTECCETNLGKLIFEEGIRYAISKDYLKDCLEGLCYLHQSGVVHKDIRSENILIKENTGKISVGRLAEHYIHRDNEKDVHPIIRAPEVYEGFEPGLEADVFQFGIVIWECLHGKRAFQSDNSLMNISKDLPEAIIRGIRPIIGNKLPNMDLRVLLEDCWHKLPDKRPTIKDIKNRL